MPPAGPASAALTYSVVTVATDAAHGEALAEWIRGAFGVEPVELQKPGGARVWLDSYFEDDVSALLAARVAERHPLARGVSVRTCRPRDWQRFWRRHFPVRRIGRALRIVPVWERAKTPKLRGMQDILVNPGLSFGTGTHFTTAFCLEQIEAVCREAPPASLLDVGTGSGILAIAAAKLGVRHVVATDFDAQALEQARENVRLNGVALRVELSVADITSAAPGDRYEVVCANLFGHLLIRCADVLVAATGGILILSGIREIEADAVAGAFAAHGLEEEVRDGDGEWCGLRFRVAGAGR